MGLCKGRFISRHLDEGPMLSSLYKELRLGEAGANGLVLSEGWVYERNRILEDLPSYSTFGLTEKASAAALNLDYWWK